MVDVIFLVFTFSFLILRKPLNESISGLATPAAERRAEPNPLHAGLGAGYLESAPALNNTPR
jgi:hypothetical protein